MKNYWLKYDILNGRRETPCSGFPQDDEFSLQQGCANDCTYLDRYFDYQYVQCEEAFPSNIKDYASPKRLIFYESCFQLKNTPILGGSLTGTILIDNIPVQTFVESSSGGFQFQSEKDSPLFVTQGILIRKIGQLYLTWKSPPPEHKLVVNYEYKISGEEIQMRIKSKSPVKTLPGAQNLGGEIAIAGSGKVMSNGEAGKGGGFYFKGIFDESA